MNRLIAFLFQNWIAQTLVVCLFLSLSHNSFGQIPIREDILDAVSFLYPYSIIDGKVEAGAGTGFFVKEKVKGSRTFLVTAKHVLMRRAGNYHSNLCIRHGKKNGADFIPVTLSGSGAARILTHPTDSGVDIAVIPVIDISVPHGTIAKEWKGTSLATSLFSTKEHFDKGHIRLGDEVFYTGWFSTYFGREKNYPIARFGRLAFLTNEKIPWPERGQDKMLNLYLIEAWATAGNSGSPVFFRPNFQRGPRTFIQDTPTLLLAGVLKGSLGAVPLRNAGIVAVVPAFQLEEIVFSDTAQRLRRLHNLITPERKDVDLCREVEEQFAGRSK